MLQSLEAYFFFLIPTVSGNLISRIFNHKREQFPHGTFMLDISPTPVTEQRRHRETGQTSFVYFCFCYFRYVRRAWRDPAVGLILS